VALLVVAVVLPVNEYDTTPRYAVALPTPVPTVPPVRLIAGMLVYPEPVVDDSVPIPKCRVPEAGVVFEPEYVNPVGTVAKGPVLPMVTLSTPPVTATPPAPVPTVKVRVGVVYPDPLLAMVIDETPL